MSSCHGLINDIERAAAGLNRLDSEYESYVSDVSGQKEPPDWKPKTRESLPVRRLQ